MTPPASLLSHPLVLVGSAAAAAPEPSDGDPLLSQFNAAIAAYSTERQNLDWPLVQRLAAALAAQRCDLKIYGYLGIAVVYATPADESPYLSLAAMLHALGDLAEQGWARCLPRSDVRRQGQLKWFSEEVSVLVKARPPKQAQRAELETCLQMAERAAERSGNALGLGYPLLRELREALKEHERALPAPPPPAAAPPPPVVAPALPVSLQSPPATAAEKPAATPPKAESAPPAVAPAAAPSAAPSDAPPPKPAAEPSIAASMAAAPSANPPANPSELSREALEDQLSAFVAQLASDLRSDSLLDPAPYWLLRALRWANHDLLRPERVAEVLANKGRSQLPLPQGHARLGKDFAKRLASGQHAAVVAECEELFAAYPLWLDLQRYVAIGLIGLGASSAHAAVRSQVSLLLQCCPQIVELRFADRDATPFADNETLAWLRSEGATGSSAAPTQGMASLAESLPDDLTAAVAFLQQRIAEAASGRHRFELRLRLVELLLQNQRSDIAMPIVEDLLAQVDLHRLSDWEPALSQRTLRLSVQSARAAELPAARRAQLWQQICQCSPLDAMQLGPELQATD